MSGISGTGLIGLLVLMAAQAQQPPVKYATLQLAQQSSQQSSQFLNAALKAGVEAGKGFFAVIGNSVQIGRATYLMPSGNVTTGSTITLKAADGRFLGCCDQRALTISSTAGASGQFIIRFYTAAQVNEIQAKNRADQDRNAASSFNALDADDEAGK